jgi:hypothetical protein
MAVVALLIAQLGALSHAYAHDAYARAAHSRNTHGHGAYGYDPGRDPYGRGVQGRDPGRHDASGRNTRGYDAYEHDDFAGTASIDAGGTGSHDSCSDCLAFAPLLSAAGTSNALPFDLPQGPGMAARAAVGSLIDLSPLLAFRSRAPPNTP